VIIGILTLARRELRATQLIRLAETFGLSPTNVKSHLTRMVAEGTLKREGPARLATYQPSADQMIVINGIEERLHLAPNEKWDGSWLLLVLQLPRNRSERERLRAALWFDGFRPISADGFVRPSWPSAWAEKRVLEYTNEVPGICIRGSFLKPLRDFGSLYDLDGLDREAGRLAAWIAGRAASAKSPRTAFVERMNVGGSVARLIGHAPRLPEPLWEQRRGIFKMVEAFRQFEARIAAKADRFVEDTINGEI
jgi:DNA-binding transcriptional regulator PaaX